MLRRFIQSTSLFVLMITFQWSGLLHAEEAKVITVGSKVSLEYSLSIDGGETVDSNIGNEPLIYTQGNNEIIPALEEELSGLAAGDEKQVTLQPEEAYGTVNPEAFHEVSLDQIPENARQEGQLLLMQDQQGNQRQIKISEIREETALLDLNHPLAGKTLNFDIKVINVE